MASSTAKVSFRVVMVILLLLVLFYVGRPLYWKISATVHDIRHNKQTVKQGTPLSLFLNQKTPPFLSRIFVLTKRFVLGGFLLSILGSGLSQIVLEAQKSVGWYHDESDSGFRQDRVATTRRFLSKLFWKKKKKLYIYILNASFLRLLLFMLGKLIKIE